MIKFKRKSYQPKIILYADNVPRLICSRCGQAFISRGIKDMTIGLTSFGEQTYVPRENVLCYNCEEEYKFANAYIGVPSGEK